MPRCKQCRRYARAWLRFGDVLSWAQVELHRGGRGDQVGEQGSTGDMRGARREHGRAPSVGPWLQHPHRAPRLLPAGGCYQMAVSLLQSALWDSGYLVCHGFKPHGKQNVSALSMPGHDSSGPCFSAVAVCHEGGNPGTAPLRFLPSVFLPAVPPPFAGKGKSCCRPSSQCRRSGAAPGGSGEAGGGCPLLPAPCSAQQGC